MTALVRLKVSEPDDRVCNVLKVRKAVFYKQYHKKDCQKASKDSAELEKELEEHLFRLLFQAQQLFYSYLKNSPQKRYQDLIQNSLKF